MRNFGFGGKDNVIYIGSNGKMSEVAAAMGLTSIESHEEFIAVNRANYERYRARLDRIPGLNLVRFDDRERCNFHYVVVDVDAETTHLDRDQLVQILEAENVLARRYFYPGAHRMEPYRSFQPQAGLVLPVTQRLARRLFQLPTGTAIQIDHVDRICDVLEFACSHGATVRNELKASLD
jgi:dTDP-4-amino-4,6-dideoxygalactose transaminase